MDDAFVEKLNKLKQYFPKNYDMIYLGYTAHTILFIKGKINPYMVRSSKIYGLFGYILSNKGASKLLENLFPLDKQIDSQMSDKMNMFDIYLLTPSNRIISSTLSEINSKFGSDIQPSLSTSKKLLVIAIAIIVIIIVYKFYKSCRSKK